MDLDRRFPRVALQETAGVSGTPIPNIIGNGNTVCYGKTASSALGGRTYALTGGGWLKPEEAQSGGLAPAFLMRDRCHEIRYAVGPASPSR